METQQNEMRNEDDEIYRTVDDHRGTYKTSKQPKNELKSVLENKRQQD